MSPLDYIRLLEIGRRQIPAHVLENGYKVLDYLGVPT